MKASYYGQSAPQFSRVVVSIKRERWLPPNTRKIRILLLDTLATGLTLFVRRKCSKEAKNLFGLCVTRLAELVGEQVAGLGLPRELELEVSKQVVSRLLSLEASHHIPHQAGSIWVQGPPSPEELQKRSKGIDPEAWRAHTFDDKDKFKIPW